MIPFLSNLAIILGAILFAYFSWRKIELGIYAIVFFLPLYLVSLKIFNIPTTALELGIYILFIIWLARKILKNFKPCFKTKIHPNPPLQKEGNIIIFPPLQRGTKGELGSENLNLIKKEKTLIIGILLLLAGASLSTFLSVDLRTGAGILKGWFFDPFLFFIILVSEIKTLKQRENVLKSLFLSGLAVAAASLVFWFFPELNGVSYDGRLHGFYASPNYLAMYLATSLIIGVFGYLLAIPFLSGFNFWTSDVLRTSDVPSLEGYRGVRIDKYCWLFFSLVIALVLYFTYSYAAWFSFFAAILLFFYLALPDFKKRFFTSAIVFLIFTVMVLAQGGTGKINDLKNLSYRSSYNSRLMIWRSAWEIGKDHWLVGIGPGNFQKYYLAYQEKFSEPYLEWAVPQPHNIFLAFWLQTGIPGLLGFLALLAWFFQRSLSLLKGNLSVKNFNNNCEIPLNPPLQKGELGGFYAQKSDLSNRENYLLIVILFSLMIYTVTHGLFDTTYWKNDLAMIFWLNLALLVSIKNQPNLG